jgi:hypothetical protein
MEKVGQWQWQWQCCLARRCDQAKHGIRWTRTPLLSSTWSKGADIYEDRRKGRIVPCQLCQLYVPPTASWPTPAYCFSGALDYLQDRSVQIDCAETDPSLTPSRARKCVLRSRPEPHQQIVVVVQGAWYNPHSYSNRLAACGKQ